MPSPSHDLLNVYVVDRHDVPIPGAHVVFRARNTILADVSMRGFDDAPAMLQYPNHPELDRIVVTVTLPDGQTRTETIDRNTRNFRFHFNEYAVRPQHEVKQVPWWFPIAGAVFGGVGLLFFMYLAIAGTPNNPDARMPIIIVLSLIMTFATFFFSAEAYASGVLPLPGAKEKPIRFSAASGLAAFIVVFIIAVWAYPKS